MQRELPASPTTALDFACGTGRVLRYLESRVPVTIGVDVADEMLTLARPRCPDSRLVRHDVTEGTHPDLPESVDLITAFRFFLNAEAGLRLDVLSWMRAVLAPGGTLIANFHLNPHSLRGGYLLARWGGRPRTPMISPRSAERILDQAGFEVLARYGYEYLPYRREGSRLLFTAARRSVEVRLLDHPRLGGLGGAFVVLATPRRRR
jgi:SAM-dependent methyltransferase